ncbi:hypothetical protein Tco_1473568 [Tanacetum coccineum]
MVFNSPCLTDKKELAIPRQTITGKEFSNPLMVGSLPKTISAKVSTAADLAFINQHNMVAYLEKSDENAEFHQIVDFLSTCSINYALLLLKQIHAIVDGKAVVISKSSVRNDLLFEIMRMCMRTRSQARNRNRRQQQLTTVIVEEPEFPMGYEAPITERHPTTFGPEIKTKTNNQSKEPSLLKRQDKFCLPSRLAKEKILEKDDMPSFKVYGYFP